MGVYLEPLVLFVAVTVAVPITFVVLQVAARLVGPDGPDDIRQARKDSRPLDTKGGDHN